jgi:dihydrofolate synthase/folylpolyglutamate synthase
VLRRDPVVILDGGHNPQCMQALSDNLRAIFPGKKIKFVIGVFADKAYPEMMAIIAPLAQCFYAVPTGHPRGLSPEKLVDCFKEFDRPVFLCISVAEGIESALADAEKDDVICIAGSLSIAGAARAFFGEV